MPKKRELIERAFREVGLSSSFVGLTAEELEDARRDLDDIARTLDAGGASIGYPIPVDHKDGDLDEETNTPDAVVSFLALELAEALATQYGKQVTPRFVVRKAHARNAFYSWRAHNNRVSIQMPGGWPMGAGNEICGQSTFSVTPNDND